MISKLLAQIKKHKFIAGILLLLVAAGGYWGYTKIFSSDGAVRYATAQVQKGTIVFSLSGSGQVMAQEEIDIKPKISGDLTYVGIKDAQEVKAGTLLAIIDTTDAQKAVRNAQVNLEEAQFNLAKMKGVETSTGYIRGIKEKAEDELSKSYKDGFNVVSNAFLDLPTVIAGISNILFGYDLTKTSQNIDYYRDYTAMFNDKATLFKDAAYNSYQIAKTAYDKNLEDYKTTSRFSEKTAIESLIEETYSTTEYISEAIRNVINLIQLYQNEFTEHGITPSVVSNTHLSSLNTYSSKVTSYLSSLFSIKNTIESNKETLAETDYNIKDQEIQVKKMQEALDEANKNLSYCYIYIPFDGIITKVNVKKGDSVSTGTTLATLVTKNNMIEVSLNEVDAAKVKVGQKATLTFDAIPDLSITGKVTEIDTVGTVSQGVVSYTVKIAFDTQDERVKPGMSVSASIVIEAKTDVLLVPNAAIKSEGEVNYVEMPAENDTALAKANPNGAVLKNPLRRQTVEIGLTNDEFTEIKSGLKEGDVVITRTIQPTKTTQTQQNSSLRIPGLNTGGGGGVRIMR